MLNERPHTENKFVIIIATRNSSSFLTDALNSIIAQKYNKFRYQVIIADDNSNDSTLKIAYSFSNLLPIQVLQSNKHIGAAAIRSLAIDASISEYIIILDSDDILLDNSLNQILNALESQPNVDLIFGQKIRFGPWGSDSSGIPRFLTTFEIAEEISNGRNVINHSGTIFRRTWYVRTGGYEKSFKKAQDLNLWYKGLEFGEYAMLNLPVVKYRSIRRSVDYSYWFQSEYYGRQFRKSKAKPMSDLIFKLRFFHFIYLLRFLIWRLMND
jgi:glycosyltransferase involved in cell wall biosynthesis